MPFARLPNWFESDRCALSRKKVTEQRSHVGWSFFGHIVADACKNMTCNFVAHSLHSVSHTRPCRFLPADGKYRHRQLAGQMAFIVTHPFINGRSEEHTSELQSLMRIWYADFCITKHK